MRIAILSGRIRLLAVDVRTADIQLRSNSACEGSIFQAPATIILIALDPMAMKLLNLICWRCPTCCSPSSWSGPAATENATTKLVVPASIFPADPKCKGSYHIFDGSDLRVSLRSAFKCADCMAALADLEIENWPPNGDKGSKLVSLFLCFADAHRHET